MGKGNKGQKDDKASMKPKKVKEKPVELNNFHVLSTLK